MAQHDSIDSELPGATPRYRAGWELLTGVLQGAAVLCVDDLGDVVLALAPLCAQVRVLLVPVADRLQAASAAMNWATHVDAIDASDPDAYHPPPSGMFDGLVLHDPTGRLDAALPGGIDAVLAHAGPMLRPGAFVYLAAPSKFAVGGPSSPVTVPRLRRRSRRRWMSLLRRYSVEHQTVHPLVIDDSGRLAEVLSARDYAMTRNHGQLRERAKSVFWGKFAARWFTPAIAIVGWIGSRGRPMHEQMTSTMRERGMNVDAWSRQLVLRSGKIIVTYPCGDPDAGPGWVVVATADALAIARRERESRILSQLHVQLPPALGDLLPVPVDRFKITGLECFVLERMPGVTADAVLPALHDVSANAAEFLFALHRATRGDVTMTEAGWLLRLGWIFDQAVLHNPAVASELRLLEASLRTKVIGMPWVDVVCHGDFKIENVMYDPKTWELTGVIDWEHAKLVGLPYIDLAYLIVYNRMLRGQSWIEAAHNLVLSTDIDEREQLLKWRYWEVADLPPLMVPLLRAIAPVHHIGCRWHGNWTPAEVLALRTMLGDCRTLVEAATDLPGPTLAQPTTSIQQA